MTSYTGILSTVEGITVQDKSAFIEAVCHLFERLNQSGIRYCHWKSNLRLERSLRGQTDLDLLVDRQYEEDFKRILVEYDIRPFLAPIGKRYPSIEDYLGFDHASGKLFHLHVHYQLVLGEQFVKNYRLPLEEKFLDHTRIRHGVKIPVPELELIVLSIRALLKYRDRDVIKDVLSIRSSGIPSQILEEIHWLLEQTSMENIANHLTEIADLVPADLIVAFLNTVTQNPRAGYQLYTLRKRLRSDFGRYQRRNHLFSSINYYREAWRRQKSWTRFTPPKGMVLYNTGRTLALVGADGAGKSTISQEIAQWLSWKLDVHVYYLGSKQPSWISSFLYLLFRGFRRGHRAISTRIGENRSISRWIETMRQIFLYGHYLSIGNDRYRRYQAGRKYAEKGSIVIFDRFPLKAPLDGPQIYSSGNGHMGTIGRVFSRLEQNLYRKFQFPDYIIILNVSPEVSIRRKPDHKQTAVEQKNLVLQEWTANYEAQVDDCRLISINAELSLEEVLVCIKEQIWERL